MNKKRNKGKGKQNFSNSHFAQEENGTPKATISMDNHGDSPSKQIAQQPVATGTVRNVYEIPTSQLCGKASMPPVPPQSMANSNSFAQPSASSSPQYQISGTRPMVPLTGISYASGLIPPTGSYEMEITSHGSYLYKVGEDSPKGTEGRYTSGNASQQESKSDEGWINYLLSFIY